MADPAPSHLGELRADPENRRKHNPRNLGLVVDALQHVGAARSIVIDEHNVVLAGNGVTEAAAEAGITKVQTIDADGETIIAVRRSGLTPEQKRALALYDNRAAELAEWNPEQLQADQDAGLTLAPWFSEGELARLLGDETISTQKLAERFIVPPFSVLDARQGYWQERKRAWLALGIESELGREGAAPGGSPRPAPKMMNGKTLRSDGHCAISETGEDDTSIFDPVLAELIYRWFCPPAGQVLDPFAGGSVRGILASRLGRAYVGIDLRADQIAANEDQARRICEREPPRWLCGDSRALDQLLPASFAADLVFTCPPYFDLERYSDDPQDLSTLDYAGFLDAYRGILAAALARLKPDRFAALVVGDVRDASGAYRRFVSASEAACCDAGLALYNEAILVTAVGSLALRAGKPFEHSRKLGKTHQNILIFCKGDPEAATDAIGAVECGEPGAA